MSATVKEETPKPLDSARRNRAIGGILVDAGRLTDKDVVEIQALVDSSGLLFGEAALRLHRITAADLEFALGRQFNYPVLSLGPGGVSPDVLAAYEPHCDVVEDLRTVRSRLVIDWVNRSDRAVLAIVGANRNEGRSWLAANLATVFAQAGERTLLIDGDMRHPQQHRFFNLNNNIGLSSLLTGRAGKEVAHRIHPELRLFVLPAGVTPPNPQELLTRPALSVVLEGFANHFDVVLIDTPAAQETADAELLASRAGAALLVARSGQTSELALQSTYKTLTRSNVKVVGSVINNHA
jgi:protein-tyrosine kinase